MVNAHIKAKIWTDLLILRLPVPNFFIALFPFSRYLLRVVFFLAAVKRWILSMGKTWKWELDQL